MTNLRIGDFVARRSYHYDILFKIVDIIETLQKSKVFILKGVTLRVIADSYENDLYPIPLNKIVHYKRSFEKRIEKNIIKILNERNKNNLKLYAEQKSLPDHIRGGIPFGRPGRVLHLDGDKEYLDECLKTYEKLEIDAVGKQIAESEQPEIIGELLREYTPDILVITGHDGLLKDNYDVIRLENYKNSKYFAECVKQARKYEPSMDELVIFAGGCQSYYEELLRAGANFASSPHRVLMEWKV